MSYAWFFHIPFIVWSSKKFPAGNKYILRFYPEGYEGLRRKGLESIFSFDRESKVSESRNASFFYYLAFSAEELLPEISFNGEETELKGNMALIIITQVGEEVIFPFDLSKIR